MNPNECNCHDCTQARWKMSFMYQLHQSTNTMGNAKPEPKAELPTHPKEK